MSVTLIAALALAAVALIASWYLAPGAWYGALARLARGLAGVGPRSCQEAGVHWFYLEGGRGPTLVLLHGLAAEADHWLAVAGRLHRRLHLLIPDLPGFGQSEPCADLSFRVADQAERVWQWLDGLGVGECMLAGSSMGGWIAAHCAAARPERVNALWLQDPLGVSTAVASTMLARMARGERNPFAIETIGDFRRLAAEMMARRLPIPYPVLRAGFEHAHRLLPHLARIQDELLGQSAPIESLADALRMPVLVEWGSTDAAVHVSGAVVLKKLLPVAEVVVRPGVGHLAMLECPARSARGFLAFCERRRLLGNQGKT